MQATLVTLEAHPRVGGVASFLRHSLEAARPLGLRPALAAPCGSEGADLPLPCDHSQSPLNLWVASRLLRGIQADVVYLAEAAALRAALWAWDWTKRQRLRLILHGSEILSLRHSGRFRALLQHAERIYTLSRAVAELVLALLPSAASKIAITGAAPSPGLTLFEGLREENRLLTVARLHPRKGQHEIIEALAAGELPGFSYDIVGPEDRRAAYAKGLRVLAQQKKLPVRFHGCVEESKLSLLYAQSTLYVSPSTQTADRIEGYGLTLLDAAAMGCVAVAYDSGGISEVVQHCRTGLLVPPGDRRALLDALLQLGRDERARVEFSLAAQKFVQSKTWGAVAEKLFA